MKINTYEVKSKFGLNKKVFIHANNSESAIMAAENYLEAKNCVAEKIGEVDSKKFKTIYDNSHKESGYANKQFEHGLSLAEYDYIFIRSGRAWSASKKNEWVTAYETLGLHACTSNLFDGMIASETPIIDHFNVLSKGK